MACDSLRVMPNEQIVSLLIAERDKLNRAIEALQGPTVRRGRPPKQAIETPTKTRKRKGMSAASRKAQSERMKARWAAKRRATKKG